MIIHEENTRLEVAWEGVTLERHKIYIHAKPLNREHQVVSIERRGAVWGVTRLDNVRIGIGAVEYKINDN